MTRLLTLRLRRLASELFLPALACLLLVTAAGGWVAYSTVLSPGTQAETTAVSTWATETDYEHSAVISEPNPVFPVNSTVDNRSAYFQTVSPTLDGAYTFSYRAQKRGDVAAATTVVLVVRNVDRDGTTYWSVTEPLAEVRDSSLASGAVVRVPFSVNISSLRERIADVTNRLGSAPGTTEIRVISRTTVSGTIDGDEVKTERRRALAIGLGTETPVYRVSDDEPRRDVVERSESVDVPIRPTPIRITGALLAFCLPLASLVGLALAHWRGSLALTRNERAHLKRAEFADWITNGTVPKELAAYPEIAVGSLDGLVDVAIDTDGRVIYDESTGSYVVVHGGVRYEYAPAEPADATTDGGSNR